MWAEMMTEGKWLRVVTTVAGVCVLVPVGIILIEVVKLLW